MSKEVVFSKCKTPRTLGGYQNTSRMSNCFLFSTLRAGLLLSVTAKYEEIDTHVIVS